jgi:hypothetical protein
MMGGGAVKVASQLAVIGLCLSCVTLAGACTSGSTGVVSPSPLLPKTQTPQQRAVEYFKELTPVLQVDRALSKKTAKLTGMELNDLDDAFGVAGVIKSSYLPDIQRARQRLAAIEPPPEFRTAHRRLLRVWTGMYNALYFLQDSLRQAVFTHTLAPGFEAKGERFMAHLRTATREYGAAMRAAARRSHVKVPARLLPEDSL